MKNPCQNNCLIIAACTELCPEKINYGYFINGKVRKYRSHIRNYRIYGVPKKIVRISNLYEKDSQIHFADVGKIERRLRGLL